MNKSELIEQLSLKTGVGLIQAEDIVNLIVDKMKNALAGGKRIEIRGFGSFVVKNYGSYWGRNPKTGEKIQVGLKKLPAFKLGKELRERLNPSAK
ncbi:MAG: integration host factor subunit beta [Deltaproteobacteria bacterium]|nr:integration host factor subunit beta [Deltaproteobacteria bacterium]